jgi:signal transduction histidine kinase
MTVQVKFALYNALSKALIILAFWAFLPKVVEKIVYDHIDRRLIARTERVMMIIKRGGIDDIVLEQDCSFESYNILKEEFVAIYPILDPTRQERKPVIRDEAWAIEGEKLQHRIIRQSFTYDNQLYELNIGEGISSIEELKETIQEFSLWIMILVVTFSIFLDFAFVRLLMKPLNKIIHTKLQPVPSPASFDFTAVPSTTNEFNQLDQRINEMMHKLKDAFQIEKEFISNVSHELQTPISIVQNKLENLIVEGNVSQDVMIRLSESQRTLNRMSRIIKALLLISKIENEQYLKSEQVDIVSLLNEVLEEIEDRLNQRDIQLIRNLHQSIGFGPANKTLLFTMFFNLLNNAIKYNKEGGSIEVFSGLENGRLKVEIKDTGIGIEKSQLSAIFERFKRIDKTTTDGYGLGLPIVKTIAGFHNLDLSVDSEPGVGTTFTMYFGSVNPG